jgi:hypothetical protein
VSDALLNREAAGARVGKTGYWMVAQARAGNIPHKRVGRDYKWTEAHIAEILAMAERRPAPKKPVLQPRTPARKLKAAESATPALKARTPRRKQGAA